MASPVQEPYVGTESIDNIAKKKTIKYLTQHIWAMYSSTNTHKMQYGKCSLLMMAALAQPSCLKDMHVCFHKNCCSSVQWNTHWILEAVSPSHSTTHHTCLVHLCKNRHKQALPQDCRTTAVRGIILKKQKSSSCL